MLRDSNLSARLEVEDLIRQFGLIENDGDLEAESVPEIQLQMAEANDSHKDKTDP